MMSEKISWRIFWVISIVLLAVWLAGTAYDFSLGLADNGDWYRSTRWFSSGPVGFPADGSALSTEQYLARYYHYWLPEWQFDSTQLRRPVVSGLVVSSGLLLWLPGAVVSHWMTPAGIVSLPLVSLLPRLWIGGSLAMILAWIGRYCGQKRAWLAALVGFPLVLMTITPAYNGYLNSFFQESADLVFGLFLAAALLWFSTHASARCYFWLGLAAGLLLSTSKASHFYISALVAAFMLTFPAVRKSLWRWGALAGVVLISVFGLKINQSDGMALQNEFNRTFSGVLPFSSDPSQALKSLGLSEFENCIDEIDYFSDNRTECYQQTNGKLSSRALFGVILHDPIVLFRQLGYTAGALQVISLQNLPVSNFNLAQFAVGDPRQAQENFVWAWETIKQAAFPRGAAFWIFFGLALATFVGLQIKHRPEAAVGRVGLVFALIILAEMAIAILGDGKYELVKHLLLANVAFDLLFILSVGLWVALALQRWQPRETA